MKIGQNDNSSASTNRQTLNYQEDNLISILPKDIKRAVIEAIIKSDLNYKDQIILPHTLLMCTKFSAQLSYKGRLQNLTKTQWKDIAQDLLNHIQPGDKMQLFLTNFIKDL